MLGSDKRAERHDIPKERVDFEVQLHIDMLSFARPDLSRRAEQDL